MDTRTRAGRPVIWISALALTAAAAIGAGIGGSLSSADAAPAGTVVTAPGPDSAAAARISDAWTMFFDMSTPMRQKAQYLQNGARMGAMMQRFTGDPALRAMTVRVDSVHLDSPTSATVTYEIEGVMGMAMMARATGCAVFEHGAWLVSDAALCSTLDRAAGTGLGCA